MSLLVPYLVFTHLAMCAALLLWRRSEHLRRTERLRMLAAWDKDVRAVIGEVKTLNAMLRSAA